MKIEGSFCPRPSVSRRSFVAGAAALGGAALLGLSGCSDASSKGDASDGPTFDKEVDIVVAGSGTGAFAALAASSYGAESVVLLEKTDHFGGTASFSGAAFGGLWTHVAQEMGNQDTPEDVLARGMAMDGWRADEEVCKSLVDNGDGFLRWTESELGWTWAIPSPLYAEFLYVVAIDGEPTNSVDATGLWNTLRGYIEADERIELLMETPATELILNEEGAVVGVVAEGKEGSIRIGARKGVILATGGFEFNGDMRKSHLIAPLSCACSVDSNTGDGIKMGLKAGAAVACMDRVSGVPSFITDGSSPEDLLQANEVSQEFMGADFDMYASMPGAIVVNAQGRRFMNECSKYHAKAYTMGLFDAKNEIMPNFPSFFVADSSYFEHYTLPMQAGVGGEIPSYVVKADTLDELAQALGIDRAGLVEEVAAFNANAKQGVDPDFGRGGDAYDLSTAGYYAGERPDLANPVLGALETPPFYGAYYAPSTLGTTGGLITDANRQVKNVDGRPIAGLYAAGNCTPATAVGGVASGAVAGWTAVRHALGVNE